MKKSVLAASLTLGAALVVGPAMAMPGNGPSSLPLTSNIQEAQFIFGGRNYCWYDNGWRGPGYYWCGYAFRRGLGWGGGAGWHGWGRGGGHGGRGPGIHRGGPGRIGIPGGHHGGGMHGGGMGHGGGHGGGGHGGGGHGGRH
jgi:hypothetical protein